MRPILTHAGVPLSLTWSVLILISVIRIFRQIPAVHFVHHLTAVTICAFLTNRFVAGAARSRARARPQPDFRERVSFALVLTAISVGVIEKIEVWEETKAFGKLRNVRISFYILGIAWLLLALEARRGWERRGSRSGAEVGEDDAFGLPNATTRGPQQGSLAEEAVIRGVLGDPSALMSVVTDLLVEFWAAAPGWAVLWRDVDAWPFTIVCMVVYGLGLGLGIVRAVGSSESRGRKMRGVYSQVPM